MEMEEQRKYRFVDVNDAVEACIKIEFVFTFEEEYGFLSLLDCLEEVRNKIISWGKLTQEEIVLKVKE